MLETGDNPGAPSPEPEPAQAEAPALEPLPAPEPPVEPAAPLPPPPPRPPLRERLRDNAAAMDLAMARMLTAIRVWALWPFAIAICAGEAFWALHRPTWVTTLDTNKLPEVDRIWMGVWVGTAFIALAAFYLATMLWRRRKTHEWRLAENVADLNGKLFPLIALPLIPALTLPNIEKDSPKLTLFYVAIAALLVGRGVYSWARRTDAPPAAALEAEDPTKPSLAWPILAWLAVAALGIGYGLFFSRLSITNHHALNSRTTDLGYYDNILYQSAHGHFLGCSFIKAGYHGSAHFDPILVLLSPIYMLHPGAEFLLGLQSFWLGAGVVPLYLLAKLKLGRRFPAVVIAAMYVLYPALQGANMYEFHSLTLGSPTLLFVLYFLETKNFKGYWIAVALALLTREDMALLLCFIGAYALLSDRARLARTGWMTIGVSLLYFIVVKRVFMTSADIFMSGPNSYSFAYYYDDLIPNHTGLGGMLLSLVTNPVFVAKTIFAEAKIVYLLMLFLPLAFVPFFVRTGRVMLIYGLVFVLLASRTAVYSIHFQYVTVLLPIAFALTPTGLRRIEDGPAATLGLDGPRLSRALLAACAIASLLISWKFGGLVENGSFKGGFYHVTRELTEAQRETYKWVRETAEKIPQDAKLGVTNKLGPHASSRMIGVFYPEKEGDTVDYVFIDESELKGGDFDKHNKAVKAGRLVQIARRDRMVLFKTNYPKNAKASHAPSAAPETDPQRDHERDGERDRDREPD